MITIISTRFKRLRSPDPLPQVEPRAVREMTEDWWYGIALGYILGVCSAVIVLKAIGKVMS